jgi:hypothetical protein
MGSIKSIVIRCLFVYFRFCRTLLNLNVNVIFAFLQNEITGQQKTKLAIWKSEDGISNWQKMTGTLDTLNNTISVNNISSFSTWSFSENETSLPLKWLSFELTQEEKSIHLTWQTATEINTDIFVIQQSQDGINYTDVINMNACGNCFFENDYSRDILIPENNTYFRIKSIDYDNSFNYSIVCAFIPKNKNQEIKYFDLNGNEILNAIDELPNGIYFYRSSDGKSGKKIIQE